MAEVALPLPLAPGSSVPAVPLLNAGVEGQPMDAENAVLANFAQILGGIVGEKTLGASGADAAKAEGSAGAAVAVTTRATPASAAPVAMDTPAPETALQPAPPSPRIEAAPVAISDAASPDTGSDDQTGRDMEVTDSVEENGAILLSMPLAQPQVPPPSPPLPQPPTANAELSFYMEKALDTAAPAPSHSAVIESGISPAVHPSEPASLRLPPDSAGAIPAPPLPPALPSQPAAPARPSSQLISAAPGRFGEELGIAIARHISHTEGAQRETLTLRLDPPEHGRIEVTLSFEDGGPLRAVVATSQPGTLDLLRRDSADLSRALGQAGIGTDAQSFSFSAHSQSGGRERQEQNFGPQSTFTDTRQTTPDDALLPPAPDYRRVRTSGSLNLIA